MTTIVAVQTEDDVLLAWDSMLTRGNEYGTMIPQKVWCRDGIVFAVSGSARFMDLMYAGDFPEYDGSDVRRWLIRQFVRSFRFGGVEWSHGSLAGRGHGTTVGSDRGGGWDSAYVRLGAVPDDHEGRRVHDGQWWGLCSGCTVCGG